MRDSAPCTTVEPTEQASTLVGTHPLIEKIRTLVRKVAVSNARVLITGESGTGKEIVARMVHTMSRRHSGPFVSVNCGAIPSEILESELFGHERGAFSGAVTTRAGLFQVADGGTLFLDEIGSMSPLLQVKILRVLEDLEIRAVGGERTIRVDVRIVAATNSSLRHAVERGLFREDLFYRLQVVPIEMPTLRARRSDVPLLANHFLAQLAGRPGSPTLRISDEALAHLWEYDWPGNVRELANVIERLVVLTDGPLIGIDHLPPELRFPVTLPLASGDPSIPEKSLNLNKLVDEFEQRLLREALHRTNGNKLAAARSLGLARSSFLAKLQRLEPRCQTEHEVSAP